MNDMQNPPTKIRYQQVVGLDPEPNYWEILGEIHGHQFWISGVMPEIVASTITKSTNAYDELAKWAQEYADELDSERYGNEDGSVAASIYEKRQSILALLARARGEAVPQ